MLLASLAISACGAAPGTEEEEAPQAAKVEPIPGTHLKRIVLEPEAVQRLGIRTVVVKPWHESDGGVGVQVPHAAVFYAAEGASFIYTNPKPRTYIRQKVVIDDIIRGNAYLAKGPPPGTTVVTDGASELLGVETGVEE
jgi:multidrug efflux pump subunit AcrA (membrane-fusion protein)